MRRMRWIFRRRKTTPESSTASKSEIAGPQVDTSNTSQADPPAHFPDGVKLLHDAENATVDICFIHGLAGNRISTWTAKGQDAPWPAVLLPLEIPNARILTYGYNAYVVKKSAPLSKNRLIDHAGNLLTDLTNNRQKFNAVSRPLIFVAHSMGGLVCKKALLLSRNHPEPHLRGIFDSLTGIMFMSSPHRGSWIADWAAIPVSALGFIMATNKPLLEALGTDNQLLEGIQHDFLSMLREQQSQLDRKIQIACFFEELPTYKSRTVVSQTSATLEGYTSLSIHANHRDMVKFSTAEETGFQRVSGELRRWQETSVDHKRPTGRRRVHNLKNIGAGDDAMQFFNAEELNVHGVSAGDRAVQCFGDVGQSMMDVLRQPTREMTPSRTQDRQREEEGEVITISQSSSTAI